MKITIEPTDKLQKVNGQECRVWLGTCDLPGIADAAPVRVWIACVSPQTHDEEINKAIARQLREITPADQPIHSIAIARDGEGAPVQIDLRFVL